ncbi:MAG: hypothetical protein JKY62_10475 [Desulfocapsa sp.]|uniref:Uncharacterized protein n=1 Tax=Desulfotalea psychrophila TaxID=84980 RepID=A0ABS3AWR8_9BACT|nr:hypothetical protein [Desulfocapsa sp.]MBN4060177.1 hypothetical protein [Desulfotalea psychrophila]MBN4069000.1 hypothetical protein [Desulfotalea psychrophila]
MPIKPGLYEQIVTDALRQELDQLDQRLEVTRSPIDCGESHSVLAQYLGKELSHLFSGMTGEDTLQRQVAICNQLLSMAAQVIPRNQDSPPQVDQSASRLLQIHNPVFARHPKPTTPLSVSSLLTATSGDPRWSRN